MSGSPPAVSEACADEEEGGHTPYQAAAAHQAAPAAHTSYLFCEEQKKSGIMILLHTIRESLKEHRTEATMAGFSSPKSAWSDWKEIKVKLSGARFPPSSISGAPLSLVAESRSRFNRREGEKHQTGARMFADFREAKEIDVSPVWSKSLQILCRRSISLIIFKAGLYCKISFTEIWVFNT